MSHWMPAEVYRVLTLFGVSPQEIPETLPNLQSMYAESSQRWYRFERGYQTFWQSLVREAGLRVRLEAEVMAVRPAGHGKRRPWAVIYRRTRKTEDRIKDVRKQAFFDLVVVTAPPSASASILPPKAPQAELLLTAVAGGYPLRAYLAPVTGTPQVLGPALSPPFAFWNKDPRIEPSATSVPSVRPFFWQRRYADVDYMLVANYNYADVGDEASFAALQDYSADTFGMNVQPYAYSMQATFPSVPADYNAWSAAWAELQGKDGLFFTGEAFLGSGVPVITQGLSAFVPAHFPDVTAGPACSP